MHHAESSNASLERYCNPAQARIVPGLEVFVEVLVPLPAKHRARSWWIFGSHDRGTACAESDIDVIVVSRSDRPFVERPPDYMLAILGKHFSVDMLACMPQEFSEMLEEGRLFLTEALKTAVPVYGGGRRESLRWPDQSEPDLSVAESMPKLKCFADCCFYSQLAAEKAVKSIPYALGARTVLGHSVYELCERHSNHVPELNTLLPEASRLDLHYIPTRSPNGFPGGVLHRMFSETQGIDAIGTARRVVRLAADLCPRISSR